MGKQLSHSWRGYLKYAFLAFGGSFFFFSFISVAWLRIVWKHFLNVSSFFTPRNLSSTLGSYKLKSISQPNRHSFRQHQFVIVEICGHLFENGKSYLHDIFFFNNNPESMWRMLWLEVGLPCQVSQAHVVEWLLEKSTIYLWERGKISSQLWVGPWYSHRYGDSLYSYRDFQAHARSRGCDVGKGALFNFLFWGISPAAPLRERKKIWQKLNFAHIQSPTGRRRNRCSIMSH